MSDVNSKEVLVIQNLCRLSIDLAIYKKDAWAIVLA